MVMTLMQDLMMVWYHIEKTYKRTPEESYERIFNHLSEILPDASDKEIKRILK